MKLLYLLLIVMFSISPVMGAYTVDSSSVGTDMIFKCQPSVITVTITGAVTSVNALINNTELVLINGTRVDYKANLTMANAGGGVWTLTYGNNGSITWGNKTIVYEVNDGGTLYQNNTGDSIFVYSDSCTGTGMSSYQNVSVGFGNYTNRFYTGEVNIIEFALYPWVEYWGYVFYIIVIFWISSLVYMKNQNIVQPLIIILISLGALVTTSWLPDEYKQFIVMMLALILGSVFYKVFKS